MLIYFAQPIDQARGELSAERDIRNVMIEAGISYFQPSRAYSLATDPMSDLLVLDRINRAALAAADGLVAYLPASVPTLGVPAEIEQALNWGTPTVIFTPQSLAMKSVQVWQWRERGATVIFTDDLDRLLREASGLRDLLQTRPETTLLPAEPISGELAVATPPLQVTYGQAASPLRRAYVGDAGLDLAISEDAMLMDGEYRMIPTGVRAAVPHGWWGFMHGRSSAWAKYGLDIRTAVIDSGYRGELMVGVTNRSGDVRYLKTGFRLAQYVLMPAFMGDVIEVEQLPEHERGENGYGSSGE